MKQIVVSCCGILGRMINVFNTYCLYWLMPGYTTDMLFIGQFSGHPITQGEVNKFIQWDS